MNKTQCRAQYVLIAIAASLVASPSVLALGFRNPDQGARATGQGEAFVAQADDPSAVYYNPGGLTQLEGTQLTSGGYLVFPSYRFSGASGNAEMNAESFSPHFYAATDLGTKKWRLGLGVNVPFGTGVDYGHNGPFRFTVTESSLQVINFAPTLAYQVNDHFSIGAGLNIYHGDTMVQRMVLFGAPPTPQGNFRFEGNGQALGATVGALWKINEQHALGAVYRSPFSINFDGNAQIKGAPIAGFKRSATMADIDFPQTVSVGYAFRPTKKLKLEVDIEWTNWDTLNTVRLHSSNPAFNGKTNPSGASIPFNWKDSFFYEFGAEYQLNDNWVVRGGYIFSQNSVPDSTFSPSIPDADRHVFSIGGGYTAKRFSVDLVYQYVFADARTVHNSAFSAANGTWRTESHALMLISTLKF